MFYFSDAGLFALFVFAFVSSITPGPNNLMLLYSGARFGFIRTLPHLLGISLGFALLLILCCLGVAGIFWKIPHSQDALKLAGCSYMLWLAYKLFKNGAVPKEDSLPKSKNAGASSPMTFVQAVLFQYVNPKAWIMGMSVPAAYFPPKGTLMSNTAVATLLFTFINLICVGAWAKGGVFLQKLMHQPKLAGAVNLTIVVMTIYCALAVWF